MHSENLGVVHGGKLREVVAHTLDSDQSTDNIKNEKIQYALKRRNNEDPWPHNNNKSLSCRQELEARGAFGSFFGRSERVSWIGVSTSYVSLVYGGKISGKKNESRTAVGVQFRASNNKNTSYKVGFCCCRCFCSSYGEGGGGRGGNTQRIDRRTFVTYCISVCFCF